MLYVRFKVAPNEGFEVEVEHFDFSPITGFIYLWKGVFDIPKAVNCNQFIEFSFIDKCDTGIKFTFYRDYKAAFNIHDIIMEED